MPPPFIRHPREPRLFAVEAAPRTKDSGTLAFPSTSLFWALGGFPSSTGVPVSPLTAIQVATVYACVKARSEDLAKVPQTIRRRTKGGGFEKDSKHPLNRLLQRPNDWMTPFAFKRFIETSICLRGNAYIAIMRGNGGEPNELVPIVPDLCRPLLTEAGTLMYDVTHPRVGQNKKLDGQNILHIRNIGMDGGYVGMSPIAVAQETIGLALAAQQHGAVLFRQGAQIGGVLEHPGQLTPEAKTGISRSFAENFAGVQQAHKIPVLEEGMKFAKVAMTNEDAQFLETRKFQRSEICAIFRVPPHKVMDLERATFTNIENQGQDYIADALIPDADQTAQEMHAKLLFDDERDDYDFGWEWDALLRADRKTRYEAHAIGLNNGFLNADEVREEEGRGAIPGGSIYRVPLNTGNSDGSKPTPTGAPGATAPNPTPAVTP